MLVCMDRIDEAEQKERCDISHFEKLDIRVGTVVEAAVSPRAKFPAYKLKIDFGPLGVLTSSARITDLYAPEELTGRQVVCVVNFPPRQVATVISQCLVLGGTEAGKGVVLLEPERPLPPGTKVS